MRYAHRTHCLDRKLKFGFIILPSRDAQSFAHGVCRAALHPHLDASIKYDTLFLKTQTLGSRLERQRLGSSVYLIGKIRKRTSAKHFVAKLHSLIPM
jgi:hypothetical protein